MAAGAGGAGGKSDPLTSAYVVLGLVEAQDAGYAVTPAVIDRGLNYLRLQVVPLVGLKDRTCSTARHSCSMCWRAPESLMSAAPSSSTISASAWRLYAQAFLTQALQWIDAADPRLKTLLSDLSSQAIVSATGTHWEEKEVDRWNWNTDTRTTAIVLSALSKIDPENPLNANAVRWLMSHRTDGHWLGTQETAWTLMALDGLDGGQRRAGSRTTSMPWP